MADLPEALVIEYQTRIDELVKGRELRVLEIGAGAEARVNFHGQSTIIGIDSSQKQLDRNSRLDEKICADIEKFQLPQRSYDVVIAWWVLEHLKNPESVLLNCINTLHKDGFFIIAGPDPFSVKGLITKLTPHWFHILIYRKIYGDPNAGKNDRAPFPAYLRPLLNQMSFKNFMEQNGMSVRYFRLFENPEQVKVRNSSGIVDYLCRILDFVCQHVLFGVVSLRDTDYIAIFSKN